MISQRVHGSIARVGSSSRCFMDVPKPASSLTSRGGERERTGPSIAVRISKKGQTTSHIVRWFQDVEQLKVMFSELLQLELDKRGVCSKRLESTLHPLPVAR